MEEDQYLFLYTAVEGRNAYICALIPKETIVGQTREIQKLSAVLTVAACIVAVLMGLLLAGGYRRAIRDVLKKLKKVSGGDLTVEITTGRKDEFGLLAEGVSHMVGHMKKQHSVRIRWILFLDVSAWLGKIPHRSVILPKRQRVE